MRVPCGEEGGRKESWQITVRQKKRLAVFFFSLCVSVCVCIVCATVSMRVCLVALWSGAIWLLCDTDVMFVEGFYTHDVTSAVW